MDGPRDYHTKRSKSDKYITYMWNLKKKNIYIHTYMCVYTLTHTNELVFTKQKSTHRGRI